MKITFTGTEAEARKELKALTNAVNVGEHIDPNRITFKEWSEQWLQLLERNLDNREGGLVNVRTRERYEQLLGLIMTDIGHTEIQKVSSLQIDKAYLRLERERDLAPRTVKHLHVTLKACLGEAFKQRMLNFNPAETAHPPRVDNANVAVVLDEEQMIKLRNGFRGHALDGIVLVALKAGMRRHEILALRHVDVDLDKALINVSRAIEETSKGRWI
jgi:integrase